jgi:hypothetical protein
MAARWETDVTPAPRVCLSYSASLDEPNTFRLLDSERGITVRVKLAHGEVSCDVELRWRSRPTREWPEAIFFKPNDPAGTVWVTAPIVMGGGLIRRELQLQNLPEHVSRQLLSW